MLGTVIQHFDHHTHLSVYINSSPMKWLTLSFIEISLMAPVLDKNTKTNSKSQGGLRYNGSCVGSKALCVGSAHRQKSPCRGKVGFKGDRTLSGWQLRLPELRHCCHELCDLSKQYFLGPAPLHCLRSKFSTMCQSFQPLRQCSPASRRSWGYSGDINELC